MIVSSETNIYKAEDEYVLLRASRKIINATVFETPDDASDEQVKAVIEPVDGVEG